MKTRIRTRVRRQISGSDSESQRLQKILAAAGLGSRRQCEDLIRDARVEVDGQIVCELGAKADPAAQQIRVDGIPLARPKRVYFLVNKPAGVVSTNRDPDGRTRVVDLVGHGGRLFTVGRLDMSSEGLILVTNDGELANRLTHPRYGVEKTYHVEVAGTLDRRELERLGKGIHLAEGFARVVRVRVKHQYSHSTQLEIVLNEGRNREIRRMLARVGHKVLRLKRVALGTLRLGELPTGHVRSLDRQEVRALRQAAQSDSPRAAPSRHRPRPTPVAAGEQRPPQRSIIGGHSPAAKQRVPRAKSAPRASKSVPRTGPPARRRHRS